MNAIDYANRRVAYIGIIHILARNLIGISKGYYGSEYRVITDLESNTRTLMEDYIEKLKNLQNNLEHIDKYIDMTEELENLND